MLDRVALLLFVLGFVFLSYLYGVASSRFSLFPYEIVRDAWVAGKALREAIEAEFDEMPPGALAFEARPALLQTPQNLANGVPRDEALILVTGGPYQLVAECPELGCLAWIMDRSGTVYHTWPFDRAAWADMRRHRGFTDFDDIYPAGMHLYDNGDLLVIVQARNAFPYSVGLAKFDKRGQLLWQKQNLSHHVLDVDQQGLIHVPSHQLIDSPLPIPSTKEMIVCEERKIYEDLILVLNPDGELVRKISVLRSLFESGYGGLIYLNTAPCDPLHLNDVRVLSKEDASEYPTLLPGDLLISIRNLNTVAVMDAATTRIKWIASG
jgi:Arylsulfotransferase (ASST)